MRQGRGYLAEFFFSLFFLALPAGESGVQAAALGGFFVVGGDGGVGASKRFQTCQWAAIFFGLDLCPVGQGAHAPGELRVEERDRIIAIAATDAEVAHVGGDDFGFREAFGELEDTVVGHVHRWPIVRDRSANLFGFPVEHGLNDHPALPRPREQEVDGPRGVGEEVAGFGPYDLAGGGRFAQGIRDFSGPDRGGDRPWLKLLPKNLGFMPRVCISTGINPAAPGNRIVNFPTQYFFAEWQ